MITESRYRTGKRVVMTITEENGLKGKTATGKLDREKTSALARATGDISLAYSLARFMGNRTDRTDTDRNTLHTTRLI